MKKSIYAIAILVIALSVSAYAKKAYPNAGNLDSITFLTAKEVKILHNDNTIYGKNLKFFGNVEVTYLSDGTYKGTVASGKKKVSGTWFVKDNGLKCNKGKKGTRCIKIYKNGDSYIAIRKDKKIMDFKIK